MARPKKQTTDKKPSKTKSKKVSEKTLDSTPSKRGRKSKASVVCTESSKSVSKPKIESDLEIKNEPVSSNLQKWPKFGFQGDFKDPNTRRIYPYFSDEDVRFNKATIFNTMEEACQALNKVLIKKGYKSRYN